MLKEYRTPEIEVVVFADIISASGDIVLDVGSSGIIDGGILG